MALVLASATQAGAAPRLNCSSHVSNRANYKTPRAEINRQNEKSLRRRDRLKIQHAALQVRARGLKSFHGC
jgi:hypothetical protein